MKKEHSAGILVYRKLKENVFLLLDYGKYWDFPKGHLEDAETEEQAARRELLEETGISKISLENDFKEKISYVFKDKQGRLIAKDVVFFLGSVKSPKVKISFEHSGFQWLPFELALRAVTYKNAKGILSKAQDYLQKK